jgi:hypothetical protein
MKQLDYDNLTAVLWSLGYCLSLVLLTGVFDALGIKPTVTVPVMVVALPFLVGIALSILERLIRGTTHG